MALAPTAAAGVVGHTVERPGPVPSEREIEVGAARRGHSNRAIASALFLAEVTVKTPFVRIHRKLGTGNRAAKVSEAARSGLIELA